jgi:phosphate transport system substrate-binding protein
MHRNRKWVWSLLGGVLALAAGCGGRRESLTLAGSTAFQPFAEKLAEVYLSTHPDVNIAVQGGGSALGIQSALSGAAQIGMADLVTLPPEAGELTSSIVAKDGIALVVHKSNPVTGLTTAQIRDIFNGAIKTWQEVGGKEGPITIVSREAGSGTRTSFEQIVGGVRLSSETLIQDSNGTVRETVANDPNAIGYLSHGLVNERISAIDVDGHGCTVEDIVAGRYPLVRPVFLLTRGAPTGLAADFIAFLLSPEAQAHIKNDGLIPAK